jgi:hypothetical protein
MLLDPGSDFAQAVVAFNAQHPILDVFADRELRRAGKEHHGPCPLCGGDDRFCVWPREGRAWCRQCKAAGDALGWSMRLAGVNPGQRGATARYLRECGYLDPGPPRRKPYARPPDLPADRSGHVKPAPSPAPINLGALDPMRAYYADFLRERRAVLVIDGGLTPRQANAEARRLLKLIRAREHL